MHMSPKEWQVGLVIFLIGNLYSLTGEQYKLANAFLLAGVLCSYALTIVVLKRRY